MKTKIAIFGDDPTGPTGFGKIVANLSLAAKSAGFEPVVVGLKKNYYNAVPNIRVVNAADRGDAKGFETLAHLLKQDDIKNVISIGDPWGIMGLVDVKKQIPFTWLGYTPVEAVPYPRYIQIVKEPPQYLDVAFLMQHMDRIVTYSEFGRTAVSKMLHNAYADQTGWEPQNVDRIYLGVDTQVFSPSARINSRKYFQGAVEKDTVLFSCVKVNSMRAGFDSLISAWAKYLELCRKADPMLAEHSKLYIHTAIEGGRYDLKMLMNAYGVENSLLLNPGVKPGERFPEKDIADIHNASDIVVSTARAEGFGLNILEPMSCKVPCIVPDYGCPAEYGGEAVRRVPVAARFTPEFAVTEFAIVDVDKMAETMLALALDPEARLRMGAIGRQIAGSLTWETFIENWVKIFEEAFI